MLPVTDRLFSTPRGLVLFSDLPLADCGAADVVALPSAIPMGKVLRSFIIGLQSASIVADSSRPPPPLLLPASKLFNRLHRQTHFSGPVG